MRSYFLLIVSQCVLFVNCAPHINGDGITKQLEQLDRSSGIKRFSEFLATSLNRTVLDYTIAPLSSNSKHFASTLNWVEVKEATGNKSDEFKIQKFVVKTPLPDPDVRNILMHFKESRFYSEVVPAIKLFEESEKISETNQLDVFLRYFGVRNSLDPNAKMVDSDYVLLLENLKIQNYYNVDGYSFGIDHTFIILKDLAKLHATSIAMRRLQPDLFNSKVKPYLINSMYRENNGEEFVEGILKEWHMAQNISKRMHIKVENYLKIGAQYMLNKTFSKIDTPYTTLCHKDVKTGNFMLKKGETSNEVTKVKMIDFQHMFYDSFVADLIPFIYLSVTKPKINANFKEFVTYYHSEFLKTIKRYKCPSEDYTLQKIWREIREKAKFQLFFLFKRYNGRILRKTKLDYDSTLPSIVESYKLLIGSFNKFRLL